MFILCNNQTHLTHSDNTVMMMMKIDETNMVVQRLRN